MGDAGDSSDSGLEHRFAPLVASLRAGGHRDPADGWDAPTIGAHVAANSDLIAAVAERVAAGEPADYDNAAAVDPAALAPIAALGASGVADEVERSARRLAAARDGLGERAGQTVHARIVDGDDVVVDADVAIGDLADGHAGFHLERHREQLRALEAPHPGAPPLGFDRHELVLLVDCDDAPELDEAGSAELLRAHLGFFDVMVGLGLMRIAGPLRGSGSWPLAGLSIYATGSVERSRRLAEDDPAVRAGVYRVEAWDWWTPAGVLFSAGVTPPGHPGGRG